MHKHPSISDNRRKKKKKKRKCYISGRVTLSGRYICLTLSFDTSFAGEDFQSYSEISTEVCPRGYELGVASSIQLAHAFFADFQLVILFGCY